MDHIKSNFTYWEKECAKAHPNEEPVEQKETEIQCDEEIPDFEVADDYECEAEDDAGKTEEEPESAAAIDSSESEKGQLDEGEEKLESPQNQT